MALVLLAVSFMLILGGALFFTNATEWLGKRLGLGEGAVGSLLAAVGTAMPETLIPIVAVLGGQEGSDDVAVGAIIGAPFLLATLAMAIVGISAHVWRDKREQGLKLKADVPTLDRDLKFFLIFFALGIAHGPRTARGAPHPRGDPLRHRLRRLCPRDAEGRRRRAGRGLDRAPLLRHDPRHRASPRRW